MLEPWLVEVRTAPPDRWSPLYTSASRRLGRDAATGRIALLAHAIATDEPAFFQLVQECHRSGDEHERAALLRALPLLPRRAALTALAIDACRTNVVPVFEAIACDNSFPALAFPEPSFNQMVLKAVFVGLPLGRVVGLQTRRSPALARMARDYAAERRAAGRSVPDDLLLIGDAP